MYLMSASLKCALNSLRIHRPTSFRMGLPLRSSACSPPASRSCRTETFIGVAHYTMDSFDVLGALDDAPDDASASSSSALAAGSM